MRIQEKVASYEKIRKWKTGLIGQAMRALLKADFHLYVEDYVTQRRYTNDMSG